MRTRSLKSRLPFSYKVKSSTAAPSDTAIMHWRGSSHLRKRDAAHCYCSPCNSGLGQNLKTCEPPTEGATHVCAIAGHLSAAERPRGIRSCLSRRASALCRATSYRRHRRDDQARARCAGREPLCVHDLFRDLSERRGGEGLRAIKEWPGSTEARRLNFVGRPTASSSDRRRRLT